MKKIIYIFLTLFLFTAIRDLSAQTGIISSDGVNVPRLTTTNRNATATPANGQLIYNTDDNCFNVYQKGAWQKLSGFTTSTLSGSWIPKADFGGNARNEGLGFSIGNKGYVGAGPTQKDVWEYDPATNVWTQKADFTGSERNAAVSLSIGNKGYYGTGFYQDIFNVMNDFWEYDPIANTWTRKADFGGGARYGAVGFSIGNKGYLGTGARFDIGTIGEIVLLDFYEYNPTADTWTQKANFGGGGRKNAVGLSIGNKGYIGPGVNVFDGSTYYFKTFWEYNPDTNSWTKKADFGGSIRQNATGFSIENKGYIGMGSNKKDFWEYEPIDNTWREKTSFGGIAVSNAIGFSIGKKGYVEIGTATNNFWEYDPFAPPKGITTQGNVFNGPNQLLQLDTAANIGGNLAVNGDVNFTGVINAENFIAPTLLNGWININQSSPTYAGSGYYKDVVGRVHLKGTIKNGTVTSGTVLFNLPVGYRPSEVMMFAVTNSTVPLGRIDVFPNGDVKIMSGGNTLLSLDGVSFRVN